jgi:hypothetical protein
MQNVGVFYFSLWNILRHLGIHILWRVGIFPPFWYVATRKIWQSCHLGIHGVLSPRGVVTSYTYFSRSKSI